MALLRTMIGTSITALCLGLPAIEGGRIQIEDFNQGKVKNLLCMRNILNMCLMNC